MIATFVVNVAIADWIELESVNIKIVIAPSPEYEHASHLQISTKPAAEGLVEHTLI